MEFNAKRKKSEMIDTPLSKKSIFISAWIYIFMDKSISSLESSCLTCLSIAPMMKATPAKINPTRAANAWGAVENNQSNAFLSIKRNCSVNPVKLSVYALYPCRWMLPSARCSPLFINKCLLIQLMSSQNSGSSLYKSSSLVVNCQFWRPSLKTAF